jgi:hypothetical protein
MDAPAVYVSPMVISDPPVDMVTPQLPNFVFSVAGITVAVLALGYSLMLCRRLATPLPLVVFLSSGIAAVILEPALDANGGCWWPAGGWVAYHLYGMPIPVWAVAAYFWFVGGQAVLIWRAMVRNPNSRTVWRCWGAVIGSNFVLETPGLILGVYQYWGQQPLKTPWGLPLWWLPVNACMPLVAAMLMFLLEPQLTGWRMLAVIPLVPLGAGAAEGAASMPAWIVLNTSDVPWIAAQLGGFGVFVLAATLVWAMASVVNYWAREQGAAVRQRAWHLHV